MNQLTGWLSGGTAPLLCSLHRSSALFPRTHRHEESASWPLMAAAPRTPPPTDDCLAFAAGANATSSRSHAVYQIRTPAAGRLLLVDLAGNEGSIETLYHSKEQMAEAAEINASLMALKNCLHASATSAPHIPYRDSTLTRVLQVVHLNPAPPSPVLPYRL